jgi:hypothetical protein
MLHRAQGALVVPGHDGVLRALTHRKAGVGVRVCPEPTPSSSYALPSRPSFRSSSHRPFMSPYCNSVQLCKIPPAMGNCRHLRAGPGLVSPQDVHHLSHHSSARGNTEFRENSTEMRANCPRTETFGTSVWGTFGTGDRRQHC